MFLTDLFNDLAQKAEANAPTILITGGIIGVIGGVISACVATTKIEDILDEAKEEIEEIHAVCPEEIQPKELVRVYAKTGLKIAKNYGPAAIILGGSIGGILAGNVSWKTRYGLAITSLATTVKESNTLKKRIADTYGEDALKKLKYGTEETVVKEKITDEDGKVKTVKRTNKNVDVHSLPMTSVIFNKYHPAWRDDQNMNYLFLLKYRKELNDMLRTGYFSSTTKNSGMFLNEALKYGFFPPKKCGQILGWTFDKSKPSTDMQIDLGIDFDHFDSEMYYIKYDNVDELVPSYILDFNVQGPVSDLLLDDSEDSIYGVEEVIHV